MGGDDNRGVGNSFEELDLAPGQLTKAVLGHIWKRDERVLGDLENPLILVSALDHITRQRPMDPGTIGCIEAHMAFLEERGLVWDDVLDIISNQREYIDLIESRMGERLREYVAGLNLRETQVLAEAYTSSVLWRAIVDGRHVNAMVDDAFALHERILVEPWRKVETRRKGDMPRHLFYIDWSGVWVTMLLNNRLTGSNRNKVMALISRAGGHMAIPREYSEEMASRIGTGGLEAARAYRKSLEDRPMAIVEKEECIGDVHQLSGQNLWRYLVLAGSNIDTVTVKQIAEVVLSKADQSDWDLVFLFEILSREDLDDSFVLEAIGKIPTYSDRLCSVINPLCNILKRTGAGVERMGNILWAKRKGEGDETALDTVDMSASVLDVLSDLFRHRMNKDLGHILLKARSGTAFRAVVARHGAGEPELFNILVKSTDGEVLAELARGSKNSEAFNIVVRKLAKIDLGITVCLIDTEKKSGVLEKATLATLLAASEGCGPATKQSVMGYVGCSNAVGRRG